MFSKHEEVATNYPNVLLFVILLFPCFSAGCWQPADWVSFGQLWSHVSFNHWCLPERPPKSSDWRGGDIQRCVFSFHGMDKKQIYSLLLSTSFFGFACMVLTRKELPWLSWQCSVLFLPLRQGILLLLASYHYPWILGGKLWCLELWWQ